MNTRRIIIKNSYHGTEAVALVEDDGSGNWHLNSRQVRRIGSSLCPVRPAKCHCGLTALNYHGAQDYVITTHERPNGEVTAELRPPVWPKGFVPPVGRKGGE
jgi:hypothetical protein